MDTIGKGPKGNPVREVDRPEQEDSRDKVESVFQEYSKPDGKALDCHKREEGSVLIFKTYSHCHGDRTLGLEQRR